MHRFTPPSPGTTLPHGFMYWYWWTWLLGGFLVPEVYWLICDANNTFSAFVWKVCDVLPGQTPREWTAAHFFLVAFMIWLTVHFGWHLWAGRRWIGGAPS